MTSDHILYLECCSGISGDMTVGALLDLGADENKLRETLESLPLGGYEIHISHVKKSGLNACDFVVILDEEHENHDHDMNYLYGDMHMHNHDHAQENGEHTDGHSHHLHRGLPEITRIIEAGRMTDGAKRLALRIFDILADAEAKDPVPDASQKA